MFEHPLQERLLHFAMQSVDTPVGRVQYRQAGHIHAPRTLVLLHGIGSGSANWLAQFEAAASAPDDACVLAWEAPGYGESDPVAPAQPRACDYAHHLWAWLDALHIMQPITLVGHSLGALMAASAATAHPTRVEQLWVLSPAQGYGASPAEVRQQKRDDRLHNLATLGPAGMAAKRGRAMLSTHASEAQIAFIQHVMAQVHVDGYTQATHLLAQGDLLADLKQWTGPLTVASGRADTITPMANCQAVAQACDVVWHDLGDVGHACALEAAPVVNALLQLPLLSEASA
jgi:pimeloyl-ACP methyl ester carboxylesterase